MNGDYCMTTHPKISDSIERAVEILRAGGVIAVPTDTVYGIAANALDADAVARVFALKGRADTSPSPLLAADADDLFRYGVGVSDDAAALARAFWPGGLTIVVRRAERVPAIVTGGLDTVGLARAGSSSAARAVGGAGGADNGNVRQRERDAAVDIGVRSRRRAWGWVGYGVRRRATSGV